MNAAHMIDCCFRHQHPECYGGDVIPFPAIPWRLYYGGDEATRYQYARGGECLVESWFD